MSVDRLLTAIAQNADMIRAHGKVAEHVRQLPADLVNWMTEAGLFAVLQPREYGGLDLPMAEACSVIASLSAIDGAVGWCLLKGATTNQLAAYLDPAGAAEIWAGPLIATGGSFNPKGRAIAVEGGYRLTGRWDWGTGTTHSRWIMGGAIVTDEDGAPITGPGNKPEVKTLFFNASEAELMDTWHSHGMRGTGSVDFAVCDVFVPARRVFDGPMAQPVMSAANTAVPLAAQIMVPHAAVAIGLARGALAAFIDLARGKTPLMASARLAEDKLVQDGVGRAAALVEASDAFVAKSIAAAWAPGSGRSSHPALALSATQATHACTEAVDILYRLAGGSAVHASSPIARAWHDIHVAASHFLVNAGKFAGAGRALLA